MAVDGLGNKVTLASLQLDLKPGKKEIKPNTEHPVENKSHVNHKDSSDINAKNPKNPSVNNFSFIDERLDAVKVIDKTSVAPVSIKDRPRDINTKSAFHNSNIATGADVDKILKRYNSPHAGKGQVIVDMCKKYNINPIMMLAIMQQESQFGSRNLKPENQANPFSVHFNHKAKGIKKLRMKDGSLPPFEKSLEGAIKTMLKLSGNSATPLSTAGSKYCETSTWTRLVTSHYKNLIKKY